MPRVRDQARFEARQQEILETASKVFRDHGYDRTTMDDIAQALSVTKASIYYYFENKGELLLQICERAVDSALAYLDELEHKGDSTASKIDLIIENQMRALAENVDAWAVLYQELWRERRTGGHSYDSIRQKQRAYSERVYEIIQSAQRSGDIKPGLNPRLATLALFGMCNWAYQWIDNEPFTVDEISMSFSSVLREGVLAEEAR